jgi:tetratricopeptide (TPR) repeat protein
LGGLLHQQARYPEAAEVLREAVAIREEGRTTANPALPINPVYSLASALRLQGNYQAAEAVFRQELSRRKALPNSQAERDGMDQHSVLIGVRLGQLRLEQGLETDMSDLYEQANQHGAPWLLNELAWPLATSAEPEFRDGPTAVKLTKKAATNTGRTDVQILDTLAAAYAEIGDFTNAVRVQQEAIALLPKDDENDSQGFKARLQVYQSGQPYRDAGALAAKALALLNTGKFAEAEPIARECLAIREITTPDHWLTFNARSMLGVALLGQKNYPDAEPLLLSGYEGMKQREDTIPSSGKQRLKEAAERLVQLYEATDNPAETARWRQTSTGLATASK